MKLFLVNSKKLQVEGKKITPEKAYKKYPEMADEIKKFVLETNFTKVDTKSSIDYFWKTNKEFIVNGEKITPEQAYKKFPAFAEEIKQFVAETKDALKTKVEQLSLEPDISIANSHNEESVTPEKQEENIPVADK